MPIIDKDKGYKKIAEAFRGPPLFVEVGIFGPAARAPKKTRQIKKNGEVVQRAAKATLVEIAGYNEFGTKNVGGRTPARSFLGAWFDENVEANKAFAKELAAKRLTGKIGVEQSLRLMGVRAVGGIVQRIASGIKPGLAARTIARKRSDKPLINTGQLRSSIAFRLARR